MKKRIYDKRGGVASYPNAPFIQSVDKRCWDICSHRSPPCSPQSPAAECPPGFPSGTALPGSAPSGTGSPPSASPPCDRPTSAAPPGPHETVALCSEAPGGQLKTRLSVCDEQH